MPNAEEISNQTDVIEDTMEQLVTYDKDVKYLIERNLDFPFPNPNRSHAAIVLSNMFESAEDDSEIFMYEPYMKDDLVNAQALEQDRLLKSIKSFVDKGGTFKLVVQKFEEKDKETEIYKELASLISSRPLSVSVREEREDNFANATNLELKQKTYFAVSGNFVRTEEQRNDDHCEGICNVNNKQLSEMLRDIFTNNLNDTTPILPRP